MIRSLPNFEKLKEYLINGNNIVFETQGDKSLSWLFDFIEKYRGNNNFDIIISYSDVKYDKLKQRNKSRASEQLKKYLTLLWEQEVS